MELAAWFSCFGKSSSLFLVPNYTDHALDVHRASGPRRLEVKGVGSSGITTPLRRISHCVFDNYRALGQRVQGCRCETVCRYRNASPKSSRKSL